MNLDIIVPSAIAAVPATIFAAAAFVQATAAKAQALETHLAVNSRMTELLELAKKAATDAATLAEKAAQHVRNGEAAAASVAAAEKSVIT